MIYVVYLPQEECFASKECTIGMFLMRQDAEVFLKASAMKDILEIAEVDDWLSWTAIRAKLVEVIDNTSRIGV